MALEVLGGLIAHQLEGVATLDHGLSFGGETFEVHRLHLRAILFALAAALRLVGTHEALYNASEAAGAAETMREWAGTMAGNK